MENLKKINQAVSAVGELVNALLRVRCKINGSGTSSLSDTFFFQVTTPSKRPVACVYSLSKPGICFQKAAEPDNLVF